MGSKVGGIRCDNLFAWNSILLRLRGVFEGVYFEYVHIKPQSCRVKVGDVVCKGDVMSYPVTTHTHTHTHTHIKAAEKGGGGQGGEGGGGGFVQRVYCRRVLFNGGFQTSPPPFPKNKPCS